MNARVPPSIAILVIALTAALVAAVGCGASSGVPAPPTAACPAQLVPAYQNAGHTVERIVARPGRVRAVILGDGNLTPRERRSAVDRLHAAGVRALAYTFTRRPGPYDESTFGERPLRAVERQIAAAERTDHVDGIFVDNVTPDPAKLPYYRAISSYVRHQRGSFVAFNGAGSPGLVPLADVLVLFEGYYRDFVRFRAPSWTAAFPASKFAEIVHDVPRGAGTAAAATARATHAANVYFTDAAFPHPYGRIPLVNLPACG